MSQILILLFLIIPNHNEAFSSGACGIGQRTYEFKTKLKTSYFVGLVEVIDMDSIQKENSYPNFTKIKILKRYSNDNLPDTLFILNSNGMDMLRSIRSIDSGSKFIIHFGKNYLSSFGGNGKKKVVRLTQCRENILRVENDRVIGNITRNKLIKRVKRNKHRILKRYYQNFSLKKTEKLIIKQMKIKN